jgi:lysozyme
MEMHMQKFEWSDSLSTGVPMIDTQHKELIAAMKIWLLEVEQKTGMRPIIYTSLHFYETKFAKDFSEYKFWIAAYSRRPNCLEDARILHWQYSEKGELPGIREKVDFNVSKITYL